MPQPFRKINVNWDIDQAYKLLNFNSLKCSTGDFLFVCLTDSCSPFYEFSGSSEFNIYLHELYNNKTLFLKDVTKPFIYIRNIGSENINLISAHSGISGQFFDHDDLKISGIVNADYCNYLIAPNQAFILTIHGSSDGNTYCSSGYYPFGFYYNFDNITGINLSNEYPACFFNENNLFQYENINRIDFNFCDYGFCNLNIEECVSLSFDAPDSGFNQSIDFNSNSYLISPNLNCTSDLFNIYGKCFTFETWFKSNNSINQDCINIAGIEGDYYFNLLSVNCDGSISAGMPCVCFQFPLEYDCNLYYVCFKQDDFYQNYQCSNQGFFTLFQDSNLNCDLGGIVSQLNIDERFSLNTNEFTLEFFLYSSAYPGYSNHSIISMSGFELNGYCGNSWPTLIIGDCCANFDLDGQLGVGSWRHIALSKYCDCVKLFVDGHSVFKTKYTGNFNYSGGISIGYNNSHSPNPICGAISNLRIVKNKSLYTKDFDHCKVLMPLGGYFSGVFSGNCYIDNIFSGRAELFKNKNEAVGYSGVAIFTNCANDCCFFNTGNWIDESGNNLNQIPTGNYSCLFICENTVCIGENICFYSLNLENSFLYNDTKFTYGDILASGISVIERVNNCGNIILCGASCISLSNVWGYKLELYENSTADNSVGLFGAACLIASGLDEQGFLSGDGGVKKFYSEKYNFIELAENQCISFLGLTGCFYDSGLTFACTGNEFKCFCDIVWVNYSPSSFVSQSGLIKSAEWNHYALLVSGNSGTIYLNGCKIINNYEIHRSPIELNSKLILNCSEYCNYDELQYFGLINNLRFVNDCVLYTGDCFLINSYPENTYDFIIKPSGNDSLLNLIVKSYCVDFTVDNCANFKLLTSGKNEIIESGFNIYSSYGGNCFDSKVNIKCITTYLNGQLLCEYKNLNNNLLLETGIQSDLCFTINYLPELLSNKIYNFKFCKVGDSLDSDLILSSLNCCKLNIELLNNNLNEFCILNEGDLALTLNLKNSYSIKNLKTKDFQRNNLFLPTIEDFNYDYCYTITNVNNSFETGVFSNWLTSGQNEICLFLNCLDIISCDTQEYIDNKPEMYYIDLNFDENRFNTFSISSGKNKICTESFTIDVSTIEESFFYKGLEFKYYPITKVYHGDVVFEVPNTLIDICLSGCVFSCNYKFPISALNLDKIKINSDYETVEFLCYNCINLKYENFYLNYNCLNANQICYKIPKIKKENLSSFESPEVDIDVNFNILLQKNIDFSINPYENYKANDPNYGLVNLLLLISSELNSGIGYTCCYSYYDISNPTIENGGLIDDGFGTGGYIYNNSWSGILSPCCGYDYKNIDYNFLMIDLWDEILICCYPTPSGCGCILIDEKILFEQNDLNTIIPYKSFCGDGYNYIIPVPVCLTYCDCANFLETGVICNNIYLCETLNFLQKFVQINSGATGCIPLIDQSGQITGYNIDFLKKSMFSYNFGNYNLTFDSCDIDQSFGTRLICINKFYEYSGIQPIYIYSNYPLLEMKNPIIPKCLKPYCYDGISTFISGYYYYIYSIRNQIQENLKFVAPECSYFSNISWTDSVCDKEISIFGTDASYGLIQVNSSSIKFNITGILNENNRVYNERAARECICFCVGGYL